ncbi:MAG: nuclear transport factor 2 family protein [Candidatus Polarisedimenticolia bacterium]
MSAPVSNRQAAVEFLRLVVSGDVREAFRRYAGRGFRHHNPFFQGDASSLMTAMEEDEARHPGKIFDVKRSLQDGDLVAVHSHLRMRPDDRGMAVVHIFRFEAGLIVECWDIVQVIPEDSPNTFGMF